MNKVRAQIDATRRYYSAETSDILPSNFDCKLTREEWAKLLKPTAFIDIAAIRCR